MLEKIALPLLQIVVAIHDVVTYPIYWLLHQPGRRKRLSEQQRAEVIQSDSESVTYRSVLPNLKYYNILTESKVNTLPKLLRFAVKVNGRDKDCLGTRTIIAEENEIQPNGRIFKKYVMGEYKWRSYGDVLREAEKFGRGLLELGMKPKGKVVIFGETRAEWYISAFGCFEQSISVVTLYTSLGEDALVHGLNETEATCIITTHEVMGKLKNVLPKTPQVTTVIYMEDQLRKTDLSGYGDVLMTSYSEVCLQGAASEKESHPASPNDVAIIMYTSGSTGTPKGVELTHWNITSSIASFSNLTPVIREQDAYLAYLPIAHVLELQAETISLVSGVKIGYSSPLTMLDTSSKIKKGSKGDVTVLKPTLMASVPFILDRIHKAVTDKVATGSPLSKAIFKFAYDYKVKWYNRGFDTPLVNSLVFGKIRRMIGGCLRMLICGGAPLSTETQEFIRTTLCVDVIIGYGLTESSACGCAQDGDDMSVGRVGSPLGITDVRLVSWEDGNYRVSDKPYPRGEVLLGGSNIAAGYYKRPETTKEEFFEENGRRWFRTGDIGEFHPNGVLKLIDRKKDLVKLQFGEYVALSKVESALKTCTLLDEICVYGDSLKTSVVALVVPKEANLSKFASEIGVNNYVTFSNLCKNPIVVKAVLKELQDLGKQCKLEKFEIPSAITLVDEPWTPENGFLTAAFKLRRRIIEEKYQVEFNRMYGVSDNSAC